MITVEQLPMLVIPSMNDAHLEETLLINKLDTASKKNDLQAIPHILVELIDHTTIHFAAEERVMSDANYPGLEKHKSDHDRHIHELKSLTKYFEKHQDPKAIVAYIEGGLTRWMIHHVKTMDTEMGLFLRDNA